MIEVPFTAEDRAVVNHVDARMGFRLNCHTRDADLRDAKIMREAQANKAHGIVVMSCSIVVRSFPMCVRGGL